VDYRHHPGCGLAALDPGAGAANGVSLFLMALVWPVQTMIAARLPRGIAIVASVLLVLVPAAPIILLVGYGIGVITGGLAQYGPRIQETYRSLGLWLEGQGIALGPDIADQLSPGWIFQVIQGAAARLNVAAGFLALTLIFLTLGLLEVSDMHRRLPRALGADAAASGQWPSHRSRSCLARYDRAPRSP
jgi:AI-2 transport protein TqsA